MMSLFGWIPFVQPLPGISAWWPLLLIPLALGISMVYKALRVNSLEDYPKEVALMTTQIVIAMVCIALILTIIVQLVIPAIPAD